MDRLQRPPHDIFDRLKQAWRSWRPDDHHIPLKTAVRPQDIHTILPYVMMMKYKGDGIAEYTLIGEQIKELYANKLQNQTTGDIRPLIQKQLSFHRFMIAQMAEYLCGVETKRQLNDNRSIEWAYRVIALPLRGKDDLYFILAIDLAPPDQMDPTSWHLATSFDIENTILSSVKRLDTGSGVFDIPPEFQNLITDKGIEVI